MKYPKDNKEKKFGNIYKGMRTARLMAKPKDDDFWTGKLYTTKKKRI